MDARSEANLAQVEPDLVHVVREAALTSAFIVIEGLRTPAEEARNVAKGASQTMHSRHLADQSGLAAAVDLMALDANGNGTWETSAYEALAEVMKAAAAKLEIEIQWGGDWTTLKDMDHFQLPWASYP